MNIYNDASGQQWALSVKARLGAQGRTLKDLFQEIRLSRGTWCGWRSGKHSPSLRNIQRVERVLRRWEGDYDPPEFVEAVRAAKKAAREAAKGG